MASREIPQEVWRAAYGEILSSLLEQAKVTQKTLAAAIGSSPGTISRQVKGRSLPQTKTREKLARFFGLTPEALEARAVERAKELARATEDPDEALFMETLEEMIEDERQRDGLIQAWNDLKKTHASHLAWSENNYAFEKSKLMLEVLRNSRR